ncbi:amidohydrolase family protein [Caballeronia sp. LP006]|uniref:amidohydrolase family protein n=1 Tax=Caballeronia sp. LP006 TaxID=3038552 RepID=UPI00285695E1|nr:amidohydrolase family protein [Caballeronia sp. LP006]MDR5832218.1 amidohydrolase family protein [Caballeronia sp. LP006]
MHHTIHCSCAKGGVDIHTHVVPASFPASVAGRVPDGWPSMEPAHACHRHVMIDGKRYRTVSEQCWDVPRRIADMDAQRIGLQALSPMPELLSYWMSEADALPLLHYVNDVIGEMVAQSGGRMIGLGAVPLQNVDTAIAELERLMRQPGFAGVEIGSNVNGAPIGAMQFDPFFEAAEALGAAVFVHALRPAGKERLIGPPQLVQALAYPTDVGLAAASAICTNLMVRRPRLRIAFSHGGGTLASLLPRLEQAHTVFAPLGDAIEMTPVEQARRMYYDALVFDAPTLAHLRTMFGDTRIMLGTDYPFAFSDTAARERIERAVPDEDVRERLIHRNAECFLGLQ